MIYSISPKFLEAIEPILEEYFGYSRDLLMGEISEAYDIMIYNSSENQNLFSSFKGNKFKRNKDKNKMAHKVSSNLPITKTMHPFDEIKQNNQPIYLDCKEEFSFKNFKKNIKLDCENQEDTDILFQILFILSYLIIGKKRKPLTHSGFDYYAEINDIIFYNEQVRPDMLKLYLLLKDEHNKANKADKVTIKCSFGSTTINNDSNWFLFHLEDYLYEFLDIGSYDEAQEELNGYRKKSGRKRIPLSEKTTRIIYGTCKLLQEEIYETTKVTNKICKFILSFLEYLKLDSDGAMDDNRIRVEMANLLKSNYTPPKWVHVPVDKRPQKVINKIHPY